MPSFSFLDLQYNLSKKKLLKKPWRMFSRDRQPVYMPTVDELKQVFNKFDSNRDGKISPEEWSTRLYIVKALGKRNLVRMEVQKIFEVADLDGDGFIDLNEFVEMQKKDGGLKTVDLHRAFQAFDKDSDRWRRCMRCCGERLVRAVDANLMAMV